MSIRAAFAVLALVFGLALVFATPPFRPPDEASHVWRAEAIALGDWVPRMDHGRPSVMVPRGMVQLAVNRDAALDPQHRVLVHYNANYTPLPYLPQAFACLIGDHLELRPITILRLGRIFNLLVFIALMLLAMWRSEPLALPIAVVGLLPMSLHLAASFSPDPMTIAAATVLTAVIDRRGRLSYTFAVLIAAVKPVYFTIVLMTRRLSAFIACGVMLVITTLLLRRTFYLDRAGVVLDPHEQLRGMVHAPFRFLALVIVDYARHLPRYAEGLVGRLGFLDVPLPPVVVVLLILTVLAVAFTNEARFTTKERLLAAISIAISMLLISASQYLTWTPPHASYIEGIQGRYFLPLLPLTMAALGGTIKRKVPWIAVFAILAIGDVAAVIAIMPRPGL